MHWPIVKLGTFIDSGEASLQTGPFGTQFKASEYVRTGIPVINVKNIGYGDVRSDDLDFIDERTAERLRLHQLKTDDIVFGRKGSADRHSLLKTDHDGWVQGSDCMRLRIQSQRLTPKFLSRFFCTKGHKDWMEAVCAFGATMSSLNQDIVRRIQFPLPPIRVQSKIAALVTAYDDLIETNRRRIALLERMTDEIYREWFVRLRFPGHERTKIVKGVPAGWRVAKLGELATTQYGFTASASEAAVGPKFLRITDIVPPLIDWEQVPHCEISETEEKKYLLCEGDIVVARTGATVGYAKRINKRHPKSVFASYLVRIVPRCAVDSLLLGAAIERQSFKEFIWMFVTGAAQPQANATTMALFPLLYPTRDLITRFNVLMDPIVDQKELLASEIRHLARTRDLLLPRLISGKLRVDDLDIHFPPSMAEVTR